MWLDTHELQAKLLSILEDFWRNSWNAYHASHDCMSSQSFRRGQPAAAQARSSSDRHKVERPMRMGCQWDGIMKDIAMTIDAMAKQQYVLRHFKRRRSSQSQTRRRVELGHGPHAGRCVCGIENTW